MALIFCGVMGLALLVIAFYPRSYASESKLMIRIGRETVGLDPTATTGETVTLQKTQEVEVNSALNILTSREILERVVEQIGADRILDDLPAGRSAESQASTINLNVFGWIRGALIALRLSDPGTKMDQAVRRLDQKCTASSPRESTVIAVTYKAASPELAHDVVEAITSVFLEEHARLSQTEGSLEFFAEQTEKLFNDVTAAQELLRDRKNAYQLTSSQNRRSILEQAKDAMRQKIYDLQMEESDLMSRYTDEYPPLKENRRQRRLAEKMLTNMLHSSSPELDAASAGVIEVKSGEQRAQVKPVSFPISNPSADQQDELNAELQALNEQELELAQLEREVRLLEGKYAMHVEKLEQARVNDALGRDGITNVKVAQPASLVHKPVSPNKLLLLIGSLMVGLIGSVGSAFAAESLDQTVRTTDQVEEQLGVPVLASLPYRKRARRQRRSPTGPSDAATSNRSVSSNGNGRCGSYRSLVSTLRFVGSNGGGHAKTIGVVGCETSKLRSRVAENIALEAASLGTDPVLLIDADARHRRIAKRFHLSGSPGWRNVLAGSAAVKSCVQRSTPSNLAVMGPGGTNGDEPAAGTSADAVAQLDGIKNDYGLIVVDLPRAGELDGLPAAVEWIDEAVLVVEAERTRIPAAQRAKDMLHRAGVQVIGVVLANRREYIPRWLYKRL